MKKFINVFGRVLVQLLFFAGLISSCYDDTRLLEQLRDHESRMNELKRVTAQQNTNLESLKVIVTALQEKDYVTSVSPVKTGAEIVGYTITFSKSDAITIHNGKDGYAPVIGVRQDETDGHWYWTLGGEWMTDSSGAKVRASVKDGESGQAGASGVTPQLKIVDGYWYVSYDKGRTWEEESLGQATGDSGYTIFTEVSYDDDYLYITMSDGHRLSLPRSSEGQGSGNILTWSLCDIVEESVTFTGRLDVSSSDLPFAQVTVYCSDAETFNVNNAIKSSTSMFDAGQNFTVVVTGLKQNVKYNYCLMAEVKSDKIYGDLGSFTTREFVTSIPSDCTNLASEATANCYIVSQGGSYCIPIVKGNASSDWLCQTVSSEVLWETFGTDVTPSVGDLIKSISYKDGYIVFKTNDSYKEGNAVIAAKDADGTILWSWHIWFTDQPEEQVYYNDAGTMMDRNLGATSATPGDVGALGLLYQWGRKDPFLGASSIYAPGISPSLANSTIIWPLTVPSDSSNGTIEYAVAHPTTFITYNVSNNDWCYTCSGSYDDTRWTSSDKIKSIYDPCPAGWRVPDGGSNSNGVWTKALGSSQGFGDESLFDKLYQGINFSGMFGADQTVWYPLSYFRDYIDGGLSVTTVRSYCWSVPPLPGYVVSALSFDPRGTVSISATGPEARASSVRCIRE